MRKSTILRSVFVTAVMILVAVVAGVVYFGLGRPEVAEGVRLVDDHPLYTARYDGNIQCGPQAREVIPERSYACTLFAAFGTGDRALAGRNFDWNDDPALLLFTRPPDGYASVSMVDARYLGISSDKALGASQLAQRLASAATIPFDGMNEYGLFVGMAAVPDSALPRDSAKPTIDSLCLIRQMLDHARNTAEATNILKQYNISFGGGPQIHYLLADASGHSVVVEYMNGALSVLPNQQTWQVATNFYLTGSTSADQQACWRYSGVNASLADARGLISPQQGMGLLQQAAQSEGDSPTLWSALYNLRSGDVQIAMTRHYTDTHSFKLDMKQ